MTAPRIGVRGRRAIVACCRHGGGHARAGIALAVMAALAGLWLLAASRVHVNTSWSDGLPGAAHR